MTQQPVMADEASKSSSVRCTLGIKTRFHPSAPQARQVLSLAARRCMGWNKEHEEKLLEKTVSYEGICEDINARTAT